MVFDGDAVRRTGKKLDAILHCKKCLAIFRPAAVCPSVCEETKGAARVPKRISRAEKPERLIDYPRSAPARDAAYLVETAVGCPAPRRPQRLTPGALGTWNDQENTEGAGQSALENKVQNQTMPALGR